MIWPILLLAFLASWIGNKLDGPAPKKMTKPLPSSWSFVLFAPSCLRPRPPSVICENLCNLWTNLRPFVCKNLWINKK